MKEGAKESMVGTVEAYLRLERTSRRANTGERRS